MNEVTRMLQRIKAGDAQAGAELLPLVYDALRRLASEKMSREAPGQTMQATALVHEAYLRLVGSDGEDDPGWENRGHFFSAAAEAMRRILVENARRKNRLKRGGDFARRELEDVPVIEAETREDLIALDEALIGLADADPQAAELVQLRYFSGLTIPEAAQVLEISPRSANRLWAYARAWLHRQIEGGACEGDKK
jgi:RNA polymerase sigma factor (TIGR02999 family)